MAAASRFQHYVLTLTAAAQPLSTVLASATLDDIGCRTISLFTPASGNSGVVYIGGATGLTTTSYAFSLPSTGTLISVGGFETGAVKLSDIYAVGTANDKLYIGVIPY